MEPLKKNISFNHQKDVVKFCTFACIFLYGTWKLLVTAFPFGIIIVFLLACLIFFLRVPFPSEHIVKDVLGTELHIDDANFKLRVVAHRGAGYDAPENSINAFKLSKVNGFEAIECDVMLTSDGVPVMFHDGTLDRLAEKAISVDNAKWKDINNIDISVTHPYKEKFVNTHIPTLDEAVKQILDNGQRIFIDLKSFDVKIVPVILSLYDKYPELYKLGAITSFYPYLIYLIRKKNPKIVGCVAWRPHVFAYTSFSYTSGLGPRRYKQWYKHYLACFLDVLSGWALKHIIYYVAGLSAVLLHRDIISGDEVIFWRNRGVRVLCWSVNTPTEKHFFSRYLKIPYLTDTVTGESSTHQVVS